MARSEAAGGDRVALGIAIILASVVTMAFADALVKLVSADVTIWQVFAARALFAIPILLVLTRALGVPLGLQAPRWAVLRSLLLVACWLALYASFPVLSLSVAAVAVYTGPIMVALLAAFLLGERVTGRQWIGVLLGFLGVVAILRPGTEAFSWYTLLPLLAAALYAVSMVLTRSKCREEAPLALALALQVAFLVIGLAVMAGFALVDLEAETAFPFVLGDWLPMGAREWGLMALLGLLSAAYFMGVARAYQIAPPSIVATFDYAYLISAAVWGFVFFAETPDRWTILGMASIAAAGLLVAVPASRRAG